MRWIKHDTDANQDAKLQNVLLDYGLEGYGLYWYCIELIAGKVDKDNITFELEHDARIIARAVGSTAQKVEEMMRYFVQLGLFEDSCGTITCLKLARRLDKSMTSNPEMRAIIDNLKSHDSIMTNHDSIMTKSEKVMQEEIRSDQIRLDEKEIASEDARKPSKRKSRKKPVRDYPEDFEVTQEMVDWFFAQEFDQRLDLGRATDKWADAMRSGGRQYSDWKAAWKNGMRLANEWMENKNNG